MRNRTRIACIAVLAAGLWACDNNNDTDAGTDAGHMGTDAGSQDAGPGDAGQADAGTDAGETPDAGPPQTFQVRLVNNVPGYSGLDLCLWQSTEATGPISGTGQFLTAAPVGPVPFRGVTPYLDFPFIEDLDYVVGLYAPGAITACPDTPTASGAPDAVLVATVAFADLSANGVFSAIASGFATGTLGAAADALPSICAPPTFSGACAETTAAQLVLVEDDQTAPAASKARFRVSNQMPNAPVGFNVCYDPDLTPDPGMSGHCLEPLSTAEPMLLAANVTYGMVTNYTEIDPIEPTVPASGFGGGIYLVAELTGSTGCPAFTDLPAEQQGCYPILAAFPAGSEPPSDNIQPNVSEGDISTFFINGALGLSGADNTAYGPSMFIWQDNFVAP